MEHSFSVEIAKEYGVNCAILLKHIFYWVNKNRLNDKHFIDGHYWTYNSIKAFTEQFDYMGERQIRYALKTLEDEGIILVANYNKDQRDRTKWYTVTEKGLELLNVQNCNIAFDVLSNANVQSVEPLPDIIHTNNNINNTNTLNNNISFNNDFNNINIIKDIVGFLNEKAETRYKPTSKPTQKHIQARLREGFTFEDFKIVIEKKVSDWKGDPKMEKYLRPETLFGSKFESYLNQKNKTNANSDDAYEIMRKAGML